MNPENIIRIVDKHNNRRGAVISILEDIQAEYNHLPQDALRIVAKKTGHALSDLYGAVVGKTLTITGSGEGHYDEDLEIEHISLPIRTTLVD